MIPNFSNAFARGLLLAGSVFALTLTAGAWQDGSDVVSLTSGTPLSGKIKESDAAAVTIEVGGKVQKAAWDQVVSVSFGEAPTLSSALASLSGGRLEEAEAVLTPLAGEKLSSALEQEVLFHLGWIQQGLGELETAAATYRKLLGDHPRGRYLRLASENLVSLLSASKADDAVPAELDKLAGAAGDAAPLIELVRAHFFEAKSRADDARRVYESLQSNASASVAAEAKLGLARAALRAGKRAEAEASFKELTLSSGPPLVLAGAWNGLGELNAEDGRTRRDTEKLMDAAYMHLRAVVQYKPRLGESSIEYERALAGTARCFKSISELEANTDRKKLFAARAQERANLLRAEYPQSIYLDN